MKASYEYTRAPKVLAVTTIASIGLIGCSSGNKEAPTTKVDTSRLNQQLIPAGNNAQELSTSIKKLSKEYKGKEPLQEFCVSRNESPQRAFGGKPVKVIINSLCQPPIGEPVGIYPSPTLQGESVTKANDGDIVDALCIEPSGQSITNVRGDASASTTWIKIAHDDTENYVSEVNVGYIDDALLEKC